MLSSVQFFVISVRRPLFYAVPDLTEAIVTERLGRKWALQINVFVFLIGAILMVVATGQLSFICM